MAQLEALVSWATSQGARVSAKLSLSPEHPRDFVVAADVVPGETLISLPQALLLHAGAAYNDAEYGPAFRQLAAEQGPGADSRAILCVLLVLEKAKQNASNWAPYMSVLPESYDDPFWWRDDQLRLLRGTRLARAVAQYHSGLKQLAQMAQRLEQISSSMRPPGSPPGTLATYRNGWGLSEAAARWARSTVWSRSFTVRSLADGQRDVVAMVPVLDMIDHSPSMEVVWHTGRDGCSDFQFVPLTPVPKGVLMANNYGSKTSDELLLAYGFLIPSPNPADYFHVSLAHSRQPRQQGQQGGWPQGLAEPGSGSGAGDPMVAEGPEAAGSGLSAGDIAGQQQSAAEDAQRAMVLQALELEMEQQLTLAKPLPIALVQGAQLCLAAPSQLYMLAARLLQEQHAKQQQAAQAAQHAAAAAAAPPLPRLVTRPVRSGTGAGMDVDGAQRSGPAGTAAATAAAGPAGKQDVEMDDAAAAARRLYSSRKRSSCEAGLNSPSSNTPAHGAAMVRGVPLLANAAAGGTSSMGAMVLLSRAGLAPGSSVATTTTGSVDDGDMVPSGNEGLASDGPMIDEAILRLSAMQQGAAPQAGASSTAGIDDSILHSLLAMHVRASVPGSPGAGKAAAAAGKADLLQQPDTVMVRFSSSSSDASDCTLPGQVAPFSTSSSLDLGSGEGVGQLQGGVDLVAQGLQQLRAGFPQHLRALVSLHHQLAGKLAGMVPDADDAAITAGSSGGGAPPADATCLAAGSTQAGGSGLAHANSGSLVPAGKPQHTALALAYVRGQKQIIRASLAQLGEQVGRAVGAASARAAPAACGDAFQYEPLVQPQLAMQDGPHTSRPPAVPTEPAVPAPEPSSSRASQQPAAAGRGRGAGGAAGGLPTCAIDPQAHLARYSAWLAMCGVAPGSQAQATSTPAAGAAEPVPMDVAGSLDAQPPQPSIDLTTNSTPLLDSSTAAGPGLPAAACCLREVVCKRKTLPPLTPSGSAAATAPQPQSAPSSSIGARSGRAPPSASRTFRLAPKPTVAADSAAEPAAGSSSSSGAGASGSGGPGNAAAQQLPRRICLPQGLASSLGLDSDHDPVVLGAQVTADVAAGDVLLRAPASACFVATSKDGLVQALMSSAHSLLQLLLATIATPAATMLAKGPAASADAAAAISAIANAAVNPASPRDMLAWHLMHAVSCSPAARLAMSDCEGVQMLADMLEDSPVGSTYQDTFDTLKQDFAMLRAASVSVGAGERGRANGTNGHRGGAAGKGAGCGAAASGRERVDPLWRNLSWPSAYSLYCWANAVVERCAVKAVEVGTRPSGMTGCNPGTTCALPGPPSSPQRNGTASNARVRASASVLFRSSPPSEAWVLAPVLAAVPPDLRNAVMRVQLVHDSSSSNGGGGSTGGSGSNGGAGGSGSNGGASGSGAGLGLSRPGGAAAAAAGKHGAPMSAAAAAAAAVAASSMVVVTAVCPLKAGTPLTPLMLLPGLECDEMMSTYGPEALSWQRLLQQQQQPSIPHTDSATVMTDATQPTAGAGAGAAPRPNQAQGLPPLMYELYMCPNEDDPLYAAKLELLAACGLGCVHFLTDSLDTEMLVTATLRVCLAGRDLMQLPQAQHCLSLHRRLAALTAGAEQEASQAVSQQQQQGAGLRQNSGALGGGPPTPTLQPTPSCPGGVNMGGGAGAGASGVLLPSTSAPAPGAASLQQQLGAAQVALVSLIAGLPDNEPVCRAARKQLRQIVHDARKNTRRRLRQLEGMHAHAGMHWPGSNSGGPFADCPPAKGSGGAGVGSSRSPHAGAGPFGGMYSSLGGSTAMHEGVWLYLQALCNVMDIWAESLGLNRQTDSWNKRHKRNHDDG